MAVAAFRVGGGAVSALSHQSGHGDPIAQRPARDGVTRPRSGSLRGQVGALDGNTGRPPVRWSR